MNRLFSALLAAVLTSCLAPKKAEDITAVSITHISNFRRQYSLYASRIEGITIEIPLSDQTTKTVKLPFHEASEMSRLFYTSIAVFECGRSQQPLTGDEGFFYNVTIATSLGERTNIVDALVCEYETTLLELVTAPIYERALEKIKEAEQGAAANP